LQSIARAKNSARLCGSALMIDKAYRYFPKTQFRASYSVRLIRMIQREPRLGKRHSSPATVRGTEKAKRMPQIEGQKRGRDLLSSLRHRKKAARPARISSPRAARRRRADPRGVTSTPAVRNVGRPVLRLLRKRDGRVSLHLAKKSLSRSAGLSCGRLL
jgi:hypothetical protein